MAVYLVDWWVQRWGDHITLLVHWWVARRRWGSPGEGLRPARSGSGGSWGGPGCYTAPRHRWWSRAAPDWGWPTAPSPPRCSGGQRRPSLPEGSASDCCRSPKKKASSTQCHKINPPTLQKQYHQLNVREINLTTLQKHQLTVILVYYSIKSNYIFTCCFCAYLCIGTQFTFLPDVFVITCALLYPRCNNYICYLLFLWLPVQREMLMFFTCWFCDYLCLVVTQGEEVGYWVEDRGFPVFLFLQTDVPVPVKFHQVFLKFPRGSGLTHQHLVQHHLKPVPSSHNNIVYISLNNILKPVTTSHNNIVYITLKVHIGNDISI